MAEFLDFPGSALLSCIEKITADRPALWGTMTPWHMLEHMVLPLRIGRGDLIVPVVTPAEKVERVKKLMLLSDAPLKRDFLAPFITPGLQPLLYGTFEESREALFREIQTFCSFWEANPEAVFAHPVFGQLNRDEWYLFQSKHFTHHLSQFGMI